MRKCLLVVLALIAPPTPGPAATLPKLESLPSVAGLPAIPDNSAVPAAAGKAVDGSLTAKAADSAQPDWSFTPGKLCTQQDSDFDGLRYPSQVPHCARHVTRGMKLQVAAHYGIPEDQWKSYEFDHLIPLAIGGNSHVENLWPQPRGVDDSDGKDRLEYSLYLQLSAGKISQAEAVRQTYAWFGRQPKRSQPLLAQR